jgi:hypothetical protein
LKDGNPCPMFRVKGEVGIGARNPKNLENSSNQKLLLERRKLP